jgi:Gram-negative bacterial TonB protein C-terminal
MSANPCCLARRSHVPFRRSINIAILAFAAISPARAQQPDLKALAVQAAHAVEESKTESVVVLDFVGPDTYVSELGRSMADQFSASLAAAGGKFRVVSRTRLGQSIQSNRFAPEIVADPEMADWLAMSVGAEAAVSGKLEGGAGIIRLALDCLGGKGGKIMASFRASFPLSDNWESLSTKKIDPDAGVADADRANGPSCKKCSMPEFTSAAIEQKFNGKAMTLAVIGKDGLARDISVTKRLPYGLTVKAVQAVQRWTFNPEIGPDGHPIEVRTPIEVVFRTY